MEREKCDGAGGEASMTETTSMVEAVARGDDRELQSELEQEDRRF